MTKGSFIDTNHWVVPGSHDEADAEGLPVDVGGVESGDHVLLDVLVGRPAVEVVEAASSDVAVVLDLEANGLHRRLVQVILQGGQKLKTTTTSISFKVDKG